MNKFCFYFLFFFVSTFYGQVPGDNEQVKINYSMEYIKVPIKMRFFKKHLPKEITQYYTKTSSRNEVHLKTKFMSKNIQNTTISVTDESLLKSWTKVKTKINDSIVQSEFIEEDLLENNKSIFLGQQTKLINGYNCIEFILEDDSIKIEGFLAPEISVSGDFRNHGLPLEFKTSSKKEKFVFRTFSKEIIIEPLNPSLYTLNKN
mgnify:CR=1 FL=1